MISSVHDAKLLLAWPEGKLTRPSRKNECRANGQLRRCKTVIVMWSTGFVKIFSTITAFLGYVLHCHVDWHNSTMIKLQSEIEYTSSKLKRALYNLLIVSLRCIEPRGGRGVQEEFGRLGLGSPTSRVLIILKNPSVVHTTNAIACNIVI